MRTQFALTAVHGNQSHKYQPGKTRDILFPSASFDAPFRNERLPMAGIDKPSSARRQPLPSKICRRLLLEALTEPCFCQDG